MAIARLTGQDATGGSAVATTASISYPGATTVNNLLICAITATGNSGQTPSVTTSGWIQATAGGGSGTSQVQIAIYYKVAAGTETSVAVTSGSATVGVGMAIFEYSGVATTSLTDGTATTNSSNAAFQSSWATPNITTTNANDLIFYFVGKGTVSLGADSWSSGATIFGQTGTSVLEVVCGQQVVSSTQTNLHDTLTWAGGTQTVSSAIAGFKALASNSGTLTGNASQQILEALSGVQAPEQVILNRQAGYGDYQYPPQSTVNKAAGRAENAFTYQQALAKNIGYTGTGSTQDILMYAYNNGITMSKIVTGS